MSLADDALAMCRDIPVSWPVQYAGQVGRGRLVIEDATVIDEANVTHRAKSRTLLLPAGAFRDLAAETTVTVGALGALSAAGGRVYHVRDVDDERSDGFVALVLARA